MISKEKAYPWIIIIAVFLAGIIVGILISYGAVIVGIQQIGDSFTVQSMNVTLDINETAIIEAQKAMRGIP